MKILMIAPEPFFQPRGTPFSEYYRIQTLCALGHQVDLITYPIGEDKNIPGLTITRCYNPLRFKNIKTGPSVKKIILDFFLFWKAFLKIFKGKYHLIHTHEEANIMGVAISVIHRICRFRRLPHLYDMHSSLVQQMDNFKVTSIPVLKWMVKVFFYIAEWISLKHARSVIVICRTLFDLAQKHTSAKKLTMIENFMDDPPEHPDPVKQAQVKSEIAANGRKVILYAGTLEVYQGIAMLMDSLALLDDSFLLALAGGTPEQVKKFREEARNKGLENRIVFTGQKKPEDIPYYMREAHVLVSPRCKGTNIPLKIYSFLRSGLPVVATNILSHTQTLTPEIAILTEPCAEAFAQGIREAVSETGAHTAARASEFCRINYNNEKYRELVKTALEKSSAAS